MARTHVRTSETTPGPGKGAFVAVFLGHEGSGNGGVGLIELIRTGQALFDHKRRLESHHKSPPAKQGLNRRGMDDLTLKMDSKPKS